MCEIMWSDLFDEYYCGECFTSICDDGLFEEVEIYMKEHNLEYVSDITECPFCGVKFGNV